MCTHMSVCNCFEITMFQVQNLLLSVSLKEIAVRNHSSENLPSKALTTHLLSGNLLSNPR